MAFFLARRSMMDRICCQVEKALGFPREGRRMTFRPRADPNTRRRARARPRRPRAFRPSAVLARTSPSMRAAATRTSRALARHADVSRSGFWETTRGVRQQRTGRHVPAVLAGVGAESGTPSGCVTAALPLVHERGGVAGAGAVRANARAFTTGRPSRTDGSRGDDELPQSSSSRPPRPPGRGDDAAAMRPRTSRTAFVAGASRAGTCPKCESALQPTWSRGLFPNEVRATGATAGNRGDPRECPTCEKKRGAESEPPSPRGSGKPNATGASVSGSRADFGFTAHGMLPTAVPFDDDTTLGHSPYGFTGAELGVPATGGGSGGGGGGGGGRGGGGGGTARRAAAGTTRDGGA